MKTLLILFILFFISTKIWGAGGVDCSDIITPDFSKLGFTMVNKTAYDDQGLGVSFTYKSKYGSLTYYSFDLDLNVLDQPVLDEMLNQGVEDIRYWLSQDKNILSVDRISSININSSWNLWNMKNFINKGIYILSTAKTSNGNQSIIDIITVGTDKKCIKKIRWSSNLDPDWKPDPIVFGLRNFELFLTDFYNLTENNLDIDTQNGSLAYSALEFAKNKDFAKAIERFTFLAEQGDAFSQYYLGLMYLYGDGVEKDINLAVKYFNNASKQGNPKAQLKLGSMYTFGNVVKKNHKEAKKLLLLAAVQEEVEAQIFLGALYNPGDGKPMSKHDFAESFYWYKRAAENGDPFSQFNLGIIYSLGNPSIQRNPLLAYMWMKIANDNGYKYAEEELAKIIKEKGITGKALDKANKLYKDCLNRNLKGC